ncbi:hypothetical protein PG996_008889 [Apiospora saccharicola]|uniref:Uncharacterized protein n=1 Tax=Apiospora saccharicola TaxID=335842 RepID=A0ABR1UZY4_9PEZI
MLSSEVVVALALGIPSFFVAVAALWIAYLTYTRHHPPAPSNRNTSWPSPYQSFLQNGGTWPGEEGPIVPEAAFPAEGRPVRRRRVN